MTGRSVDAIRRAILGGSLPKSGTTNTGRPLVRVADLERWHTHVPQRRGRSAGDRIARTGELLAQLGPLTASELALAAGIHPGNVRKHLRILEHQGKARSLPNGEWSATTSAETDNETSGEVTLPA